MLGSLISRLTPKVHFGTPGAKFWQRPVSPDVPVRAVAAYRAEALPEAGPRPWLDRPNALELIDEALARAEITPIEAGYCRKWVNDGYIILERFFSEHQLEDAWTAYEVAVAAGTIPLQPEQADPQDLYPGRFLNPHRKLPEFAAILRDSGMLRIVSVMLGAKARPFQTISCHKGSQQHEHSDSIHMTTYPIGYLAANWIAFEDIDPACGPLVYYPGSHKLPYLLSKDVGIGPDEFADSFYTPYAEKYEPAVAHVIARDRLEPHYFHAKKGDVLLWHANLLHGGSARKDWALSRKALVCHYFAEGCICYHDLAAGPANFD
jgi:hypothetical protein